MSLRQIRDTRDNQPDGFNRRIRGRTPDERLADLEAQVETALNQRRLARYTRLYDGAMQGHQELNDALARITTDLGAALKRMAQTGDPGPVFELVQAESQMLTNVLAAVDELDRDAEAANALVDMDVCDFEESEINRFPALANSQPDITEAWLTGDPDAPEPMPKGGAS